MVYRVYVEKKQALALEAAALLEELNELLGMTGLERIRILNRYDVENISAELFDYIKRTVLSEPQLDVVSDTPELSGSASFVVEYLPGQFDQRADSAAQCIQIISQGDRPLIRTAKVYALYGQISEAELERIKKYVINPVEARETSPDKPDTLALRYTVPTEVRTIDGFLGLDRSGLETMLGAYGLAMDIDDLLCCQEYFRHERRDPTVTELRVIDTYWSDHCRHTTFLTVIDNVKFEDELLQKTYEEYIDVRRRLGRTKPVCLMDLATVAVKHLRRHGKLDRLDESEEINACTVKIELEADGVKEPWLLLFKNETHNHPTEIEPFGGAATCIGGAIRDPLSGRSYVYGAMRVTGAADPRRPVSETLSGKLPQRKIVTTAAAGYSSYGNQIGLATGIVDELYHPGYAAKRMEIGAVIAAAPAANVRRERPVPGDVVILLGGATGRDGCGGATGSSKSHTASSLESCGAEVQKGNAPEERKLQRFFRNSEACRLIKRCNDFGAGGVSVAVGELADGLRIDLNALPKKYEGLDGTELAISESQERMAVVASRDDVESLLRMAREENIMACPIALVTDEPYLVMDWNGKRIVSISRAFLDTNGAQKHINVEAAAAKPYANTVSGTFSDNYRRIAGELNTCSKRGLAERFDSTIGAGTVLMPFGGKYQLTPAQAMVQKISVEKKHTEDCSLMAYGFNPYITERSPYHGAYLAVVESICKLIAAGASFAEVYLSFQEYFERLGKDPKRWGKPLSALLGAFKAQMELGVGAIGGKDSMSGSFEDIDVPPTLVSFAVTTAKTGDIISPEFKAAGNSVVLVRPVCNGDGLPDTASMLKVFDTVTGLIRSGRALSCYTPGMGGVAEAVMKMCFGNGFGFEYAGDLSLDELFGYSYGAFVLELDGSADGFEPVGTVSGRAEIRRGEEAIGCSELLAVYEDTLEGVYSCNRPNKGSPAYNVSYTNEGCAAPRILTAKPRVLIPVFPGTNCEYDSAKAVLDAGADAEIFVVKNLTADDISGSVERFSAALGRSQMIFIPGGFSGGDEPDGSGKFITAFFRNASVREGTELLLNERGGLICGICNGFQALIKLGLVPYGKITDTDEDCPTLTFNSISRHQSKIVRTRIASNKSPFLSFTAVGEIYNVPISHGEGRFIADERLIRSLAENGQIATQYVDAQGNATMDIRFNPNGSVCAIEGITSPDGRVFGKMGHSERIGKGLYKNVPGAYDIRMFEAAVKYFKG